MNTEIKQGEHDQPVACAYPPCGHIESSPAHDEPHGQMLTTGFKSHKFQQSQPKPHEVPHPKNDKCIGCCEQWHKAKARAFLDGLK